MYIQFLQNFSLSSNSISESMVAYIQFDFSSAVPALKYLFPLSFSFFKGWTEVPHSFGRCCHCFFLQLQYKCLPCGKAIQGLPLLLSIILWYINRIGYKIFKEGKEIKEKLRKFSSKCFAFYISLSKEWWEQKWQPFKKLKQFFK